MEQEEPMSSARRIITSNVVTAFLSRNTWRYLEVQQAILDLLSEFKQSTRGRAIIYAIYSRADKQRGREPLKEAWQIKEKVNRQRSGNPSDPHFDIQSVTDIIALTVVCLYPSGIAVVKKF